MSSALTTLRSLVPLLALSGCMINPTLFAGASYEPAPSAVPGPKVRLSVTSAIVTDGIPREIEAGSPFALDLDEQLRAFAAELETHYRTAGFEADVVQYDGETAIENVFGGLKGGDVAANAAASMVTLGLFGHLVKYDVHYTTKMHLDVRSSAGKSKTYHAEAIAHGKLDANRNVVPQHVVVVHESTAECLRRLRDQIRNGAAPPSSQ